MPKHSIFVARFPFKRVEDPDVTEWLLKTIPEMKAHPSVSNVGGDYYDTTPITSGRNKAVLDARKAGADFICMVDSDMSPDLPYPGAQPFWQRSFEHLLKQPFPSMVGVPYCGPPPLENCYVFYWKNQQSHNANTDMALEMYERAHAEMMAGIQPCAALPTGLILIDMRCFDRIPMPWFEYEWKGDGPQCAHCGQAKPGPRADRASTEDVYFTRNAAMFGCGVFCDWDAWAGHWKFKKVGKPSTLKADQVQRTFVDAAKSGRLSGERMVRLESKDPVVQKAIEQAVPWKAPPRLMQTGGEAPPVIVGEPDWGKAIGKAREESLKTWGSDYEER
jgi:hypothetical protein